MFSSPNSGGYRQENDVKVSLDELSRIGPYDLEKVNSKGIYFSLFSFLCPCTPIITTKFVRLNENTNIISEFRQSFRYVVSACLTKI